MDATEEDKDGGSPKQVNIAEMIEPMMTPTQAKIEASPPTVEIAEFDEESIKRAIQMKPRSLSFVLQT